MPNNTEYILKLETKLKEQENLIANFEKEQSASIQVFNQQKKTIERLNSDIQILTDGHERLQGANSQLNQQAKANQKQIKELQKENKSLNQDLAQAENSQAKTTEQNKTLAKELTSANKTIKDLSSQNTSLIEKYTQLENNSQNIINSLTTTQKEVISLQAKNQILENKLEEWETEKEEILTKAEQARNEQANQIEALEQENNQLDTDLNKAVDLLETKDQTIANLHSKNQELNKIILELKNQVKTTANIKQTTKTFLCSDCQQEKPHQELSRQFSNFSFCLECSKKARQIASQQKQKPQPQEFICHLCEKPKTEIPAKMKLDQTLTDYSVCSECRPTAKEFNEADLITDDLWNKYPYSSASEILELEFGIVRK